MQRPEHRLHAVALALGCSPCLRGLRGSQPFPQGARVRLIELRDTATIETQIMDGNTLLHSDSAQVHYLVVMTGGADRWQVRVLETVP